MVQHEHRQTLTQRLGFALEVGKVRAAVELGALHQRLVEETRASLQRVDAQSARGSMHVQVHLGDPLREVLEHVRPLPRRSSPEGVFQILILGRGGGRALRLGAPLRVVAALEVPKLRLDELSVVLAFLALGHAQVGVDEPSPSFVRHLLRRFALLPSAGLGRHRRGGPDAKRAGSPPVDAFASRAQTEDTRAPPEFGRHRRPLGHVAARPGVPHRRPRETRRIGRRRHLSSDRFSRRRSSRIDRASRVDRAFIERAENRFRGSFSRKALMFQLDCLGDHIGGCLPRRSPFRSRAWHARRPPVDLRERSHHGACLFATRLVRSRPRPVARVGRGPEPPTDDASRLVRGFSHRLPRNPRRAPRRAGGGRRPPSTAERSGRSGCANECEHVRIAFELVLASPSSPTRRVRRVGASRSAFRARALPSDFSSRGRPTRNLSPSPDSRPLTPPLTAHTPVRVHASHAGFEVLGRR